jgi:predicted RNA-binding Zn-ribbon protein involved in translation (DUF1610 family)
MNDIERAIESCRTRHGSFLGHYKLNISDSHREKLENQMKLEQVKISALEKQIPKKPSKFDGHYCRSCEGKLARQTDLVMQKFCHHCGQKQDWRVEEC